MKKNKGQKDVGIFLLSGVLTWLTRKQPNKEFPGGQPGEPYQVPGGRREEQPNQPRQVSKIQVTSFHLKGLYERRTMQTKR
jgi:hypothetical protein